MLNSQRKQVHNNIHLEEAHIFTVIKALCSKCPQDLSPQKAPRKPNKFASNFGVNYFEIKWRSEIVFSFSLFGEWFGWAFVYLLITSFKYDLASLRAAV